MSILIRALTKTVLLLSVLIVAGCFQPSSDKLTITYLQEKPTLGCPVSFIVEGPQTSEGDSINPFLAYRFTVHLSHGNDSVNIPGYFAGDGNAANTGATSGNKWIAHFTPDRPGRWKYRISFVTGYQIAVNAKEKGEAISEIDGIEGSFKIADERTGKGFYKKGMLRYKGKRYLQFDDGDYFLKLGPGGPENFLGYADFDDTKPTHTYSEHIQDWNENDVTWKDGKGKGIIGAINYLSEAGANSLYLILFTLGGDGDDVWPWINTDERLRYDVSKLAQWQLVFNHMQERGIHINMFFNEEENDLDLDGGDLGMERKLYYREMIARFGHLPAVTWNLGEELNRGKVHGDDEENSGDPYVSQIKQWASYVDSLGVYDKLITGHPFDIEGFYTPLLGFPHFTGAGIQTNHNLDTIYHVTKNWIQKSADAGVPWVVSNDEQGGWQHGLLPSGESENFTRYRKKAIWPCFLAGGAGIEFYFGYSFPHNDLNLEDFKSRETMWHQGKVALELMKKVPFCEMEEAAEKISGAKSFALAGKNDILAYFPDFGVAHISTNDNEAWKARFFDPVNGELLSDTLLQAENGKLKILPSTIESSLENDIVALFERSIN